MSENIKMIICDVDGTLLGKGEEKPDRQVVYTINRLIEKGFVFAVASGRSYTSLKEIFSGVSSDMYYICFDGALAVKNEETVFQTPVDKSILTKISAFENCNMVFYGKEKSSKAYENLSEVYKVAVPCGMQSARFCTYTENNRLLTKVYHGKDWIEYANSGTDKSCAIKFLQEKLRISRDKTAAFGDNYNDVGMLRCAAHSYAVAGATAEVKMLARYKTDNVIEEIIKNWL